MAEVKNRTFDSYIKEFIGACSHKNVIRFINSIYDENFPLDSVVKRLETESNKPDGTRRSDFMIEINDRVFHVEVQTNDNDNEMVFRMVEYGFRAVFMHGKVITNGRLELDFPDPVVIYLRNTDETPNIFPVRINFSKGHFFEYEIPVKRLGDYTLEELFEKKLYALALFYPMTHEKTLSKKHTVEDEKRFADEIIALLDRIDAEREKDEIDKGEYIMLLDVIEDVTEKVVSKSEIINREEVGELMEKIQKKYAIRVLNDREEARQEIRIETAREMKKDNVPLDTIQKYTKLPADAIAAL